MTPNDTFDPFGDDDSLERGDAIEETTKKSRSPWTLSLTLAELTHPARRELTGPQRLVLDVLLFYVVREDEHIGWTKGRHNQVKRLLSDDRWKRLCELTGLSSASVYSRLSDLMVAGFVVRGGTAKHPIYWAYRTPELAEEDRESRGAGLVSPEVLDSPETPCDTQRPQIDAEGPISASPSFLLSSRTTEVQSNESLTTEGSKTLVSEEIASEESTGALGADAPKEATAANGGRPQPVQFTSNVSTPNGNTNGNDINRGTAGVYGHERDTTELSNVSAMPLPSPLTGHQGGALGDANNETTEGVYRYRSAISKTVSEDDDYVTRFERDNAAQIRAMLEFGITRTKTLQIIGESKPTLEMVEALIELSREYDQPTGFFVERASLGRWPRQEEARANHEALPEWSHPLPDIRDEAEMKMRLAEFARARTKTIEEIEREHIAGKSKKAVADW